MHDQPNADVVRIALANSADVALVDPRDAQLGRFSWRLHSAGYAVRSAWVDGGGRTVYLHREVLDLSPGDGVQCDHINRNRLDCRRDNLRVVTNAENCQNRPGRSGYRGVHFDASRQLWAARVKLDYKHRWLGLHETPLDAARAAEAFRRKHTPFAVADAALDPVPECRCLMCRPSLRPRKQVA